MEALYGLLDDAGDDAEGNITLFINMRHHKGYLILFPDCPAVIAGVGNGIDTDGEPDKDGAFMDVFHSSGVFSLNLTFFHVFLAGVAFHTFDICVDNLSEAELKDEKVLKVVLKKCIESKSDIKPMADGKSLDMLTDKIMELVRDVYL